MAERLCVKCGLPESEHCVFETREIPEGCVCYDDGWDTTKPIPPVCNIFIPQAEQPGVCDTCEHNFECHKQQEGSKGRDQDI